MTRWSSIEGRSRLRRRRAGLLIGISSPYVCLYSFLRVKIKGRCSGVSSLAAAGASHRHALRCEGLYCDGGATRPRREVKACFVSGRLVNVLSQDLPWFSVQHGETDEVTPRKWPQYDSRGYQAAMTSFTNFSEASFCKRIISAKSEEIIDAPMLHQPARIVKLG